MIFCAILIRFLPVDPSTGNPFEPASETDLQILKNIVAAKGGSYTLEQLDKDAEAGNLPEVILV
jgi:hypothetical protein